MSRVESPTSILGTDEDIDRAIRQAVREAVLDHKRAGNPIVGVVDGEIVTILPEEIVIADDED